MLARRGERLRPVAEHDGRGWVVGYGHRASAREGARVSADEAWALLVYDLSQSADRVEPLLVRPTPPALFDALNAYAWRIGPDAFARSDVLRRHNAGEALTPDEAPVLRDSGPGSREEMRPAVLAAADAVRDRVSQVLDAPAAPPPPRSVREPWPEPAAPRAPTPVAPAEPGAATSDEGRAAVEAPASAPVHEAAADVMSSPAEEEPPPPPFPEAPSDAEPEQEPKPTWPPAPTNAAPWATDAPPQGSPNAAEDTSDPLAEPLRLGAPVAGLKRGGRPRLWDRLRGDPRLYLAVGACGLVLFLCALVGVALEHPTLFGLALGLVGVLCLAPATAFFLQRRGERQPPAA